ncbi:MAG: penicillin-binding transpeptidase domain-containing protein [Eubacteriales bacterium]|nr:penicillin-binding transpeptidase domain-containing protein [Eubacteriales bacterium]
MLRELLEIIKDFFIRLFQSRIFAIGVILTALFGVLSVRLFRLQIVSGDDYLQRYIENIEQTVEIPGTRGNIYDADGNLLAYNKLSYNVTITDNGAYDGDYNARNRMLYELALILEKHGVSVRSRFEVAVDENGNYYYTSSSDAARRRLIAAVYRTTTDKLDDESGKYPSDISAYELFQRAAATYEFGSIKDRDGKPLIPDESTMLDMVRILFTMRQTAFRKFEKTTIAEGIDEVCMAELLENQGELQGVDVEETYIRRYSNAKYFSHIIGYTGAVQDEKQLAELQKSDPSYTINDTVGATGIEKTMEAALQGTKGERRLYVDSQGQIQQVISETPSRAGDNVYLTIEQNLQIGVYHLLEQQLASILASKIVNLPSDQIERTTDASKIVISVDDAYYQLINNNILNTRAFSDPDAGNAERQIAAAFSAHKEEMLAQIRAELEDPNARSMRDLSTELAAYMRYIYSYLASSEVGIVRTDRISQVSDTYLAWRDESISLRQYIYSGISEDWIDTTKLQQENDVLYSDADAIYNQLVSFIIERLSSDTGFDKSIYQHMIISRTQVTGRLLCMALYEQGVLEMNEARYQELAAGNEDTAYNFLINRILDIEITPAQLALDPCMGSVVVTDINTGAVKALVTYPGYDNNRISDPAYFSQCLNDLSLPLINSSTQTNKAPGSTFKPISAIAVLEEHKMTVDEMVDCVGTYTEVDPPINCWIGRPGHGPLTVEGAIENSCNYSFAEYGHRLATQEDGTYSTTEGVEKLAKYAAMFGLDRKSGVQIDENEPHISDEDPERTAFGQATHSYNNVQLARYATTLANNGKLFDLTILQKETDVDGNLIQEFPAEQIGTVELSQSTWDIVHSGLRKVITTGVASRVFRGYDTVDIAGKTGTSQEIKTRANHGFFISYAPYENPEIAVTSSIPFGYSSGNAANVAKRVYDFYYGKLDLSTIVNQDARGVETINVTDG